MRSKLTIWKITDVSGVEAFFSVKKTVEIRDQKEARG